jgi:hypothetical protein
MCLDDLKHDVSLLPTKGQADAIARDSGPAWKFTDVIYQEELVEEDRKVALAPLVSVHLFVRTTLGV